MEDRTDIRNRNTKRQDIQRKQERRTKHIQPGEIVIRRVRNLNQLAIDLGTGAK